MIGMMSYELAILNMTISNKSGLACFKDNKCSNYVVDISNSIFRNIVL